MRSVFSFPTKHRVAGLGRAGVALIWAGATQGWHVPYGLQSIFPTWLMLVKEDTWQHRKDCALNGLCLEHELRIRGLHGCRAMGLVEKGCRWSSC